MMATLDRKPNSAGARPQPVRFGKSGDQLLTHTMKFKPPIKNEAVRVAQLLPKKYYNVPQPSTSYSVG